MSCDFADWRVKINAGFPSAADCQVLVVCWEQLAVHVFPVGCDEARDVRALRLQCVCASSRSLRFVSTDVNGNVCFPKSRARPEGSFCARLKDASSPLTDRPWRAPDTRRDTSRLRSVQHLLLRRETENHKHKQRFHQSTPSPPSSLPAT